MGNAALKSPRLLARRIFRWLRFLALMLVRSQGIGNRWTTMRCIVRALAHRAGWRRSPKEYRLVLEGTVFYCDASRSDFTPYAPVWIDREYEPDARFLPQAGATVVDVGAQVGFYAIRTAKAVGTGKVYAVEPDPDSFARLQKNVQANALANVRPMPVAFGSQEGTVYFCQAAYSVDSHVSEAPVEGAVQVRRMTLDALVADENLPRIDLLKVDTEGAEVDVLAGGRRALERTAAAVIEIHGQERIVPVDRIMQECGLAKVRRADMLHYYVRADAATTPPAPRV
jgi:FkbM family methyltransferase